MKNSTILKFSIAFLTVFGFTVTNAQVLTNNGQSPLISNSNVIIDGSTNYSTEAGAGPYVGKGIIIPSVDLVNFVFDLTLADGSTFPTFFDGMIVYNNTTGTTLTTGNRSSVATPVVPGFYYFSNPNGATNANVTGGVWKSLGGSGTAGLIVKRVAISSLTAAANGVYIVSDVNTPSNSAMPILATYEDASGNVTSINIKNRVAGTSFSVTFAATPESTGFINYAFPSDNVTTVVGTTGPAGADGATGPQGPIGLTGPAGANGTNGIDGAIGATGPAGPQGIQGLTGATGPQGPIGLTGSAGTDGATGPQGPIGLTGPAGAAGANGAAATVAVGTVTALAAGATPTVTNSGTSAEATLNFGIPTSTPVVKGTQATDGTNTAFTIANSNISATSVVTVSYFNSNNEIISHAISAITAGSFTVQFAAPPASGGSILYTIVN